MQAFNKWLKKSAEEKPIERIVKRKRKTTNCPYCEKPRADLKIHLITVHGMDEAQAKGVKSQFSLYKSRQKLSENQRKTKARHHERMLCPLSTCHKVVRRMDNHLRDTHHIKDNSEYKSLLKKAVPQSEFLHTEEESAESSQREDELDNVKDILKQGGAAYLEKINGTPSDLSSDDDDWLLSKVRKLADRKEMRKEMSKNKFRIRGINFNWL